MAAISEPAVFAPGVISTGEYESHAAFSPDGETIYFLKNTADFNHWTIVSSRLRGGKWSTPQVVPFSGRYSDADPFVTADGSQLYFISNRPVDGKPKEDLDIWVVERKGDSWGEPRNLGTPVNSPGAEWFPTIAADGTLYFGSDREGGKGRTDLWRARLVDGKYAQPENLGDAVNSPGDEYEPLISPDGTVLIFMAARKGGQGGGGDLWVSYFRDGAWTPAANLPPPINSPAFEVGPKVTPDGRSFFFTSTRRTFAAAPLEKALTYEELSRHLNSPGNGLGDLYKVDLQALHLERPWR